ncbi:hypothetical protein NQ318_001811 [Aromia moschata]|uniref:ZAD domain-containing protein n=1 Tax=Aromia moschata TaxID=1265417 RepID=A0AAV8Z1L2_9CUCU|nr:hypothetical protein NQ318_001811 [Aromia moschata]
MTDETEERLNIMEVYLNRNDIKAVDVPDESIVCRLCLEMVDNGCCISLDCETKDVVTLRILLEKYFPELDLYVTKDPAICKTCHLSLQNHSDFIKNCLDTTEKNPKIL